MNETDDCTRSPGCRADIFYGSAMRLLVVSPRFCPSNAADHHRVRLLIPHLMEAGCEVVVLAVQAEQVACPVDEWLLGGLPAGLIVRRVRALAMGWGRIPGLRGLAARARGALAREGDRLLSSAQFDLVYFSTTEFPLHDLGIRWKEKFGVPFAMDYQDPWITDYYRAHPDLRPPGGSLKYEISSAFAKRMEPRVLRACSGVTAVSADYPQELRQRYPWFQAPSLVLPFPGDRRDLDRALASASDTSGPQDGTQCWVYVGVVPPSMTVVVRALFRALRDVDHDHLRLHFIGTSYAAAGTGVRTVEPIAREFGLEDIVSEQTDRIPYSTALARLKSADGILALGTNDSSYTASKIYSNLLANRPLLAIFHERSSVVDLIRAVGGAQLITFQNEPDLEATLATRLREHFGASASITHRPLDESAFAPYTAAHQARELLDFLRQLITK